MSEEHKCNCKYCKLYVVRQKALESDNIEFVKEILKEFADSWLNVSEDLDYYNCIIDGSWPQADEILTNSLEKFKNHPNRDLEQKY